MDLRTLLAGLFRSSPRAALAAALQPERQVRVGFDDREVVCLYPEGIARRIGWDELAEVGIRTTSEGPFAPDVFWGLHDATGAARVVYPGGATGDAELLRELGRRLPGFDHLAVIDAMGCTDDARFVVWRR